MNKRNIHRAAVILLVGITGIAGLWGYKQWSRDKAMRALETHREELISMLNRVGTQTDFIGVYNWENNEHIKEKVSLKEHELRDRDIRTDYGLSEVQGDNLKVGDYIQVDGVEINGVEQSKFTYNTKFIGDKVRDEFDVGIDVTVDIDKLSRTIENLADTKINKEMHGASGKMTSGKMELTSKGQVGRTYDKDKLMVDIREGVKDVENGMEISIELIGIPVYPSESDIMSITEKLSSFTTNYSSSGASRKQNIKVGSSNINGTIILPGETMSVDKEMERRNKANGYAKAGSYLNGETVQTYGGGICQVSTTLYGAILRAGIIPVERNAHSMSVSYVPLGLDAAVSEGSKDLKIKNTYDSPIYIESISNGSSLTFNIYGKLGLMGGYTYKPMSSTSNNGLRAKSWLSKYKDGVEVEKISLFSSTYRPHN